jgi:integrase/recombinase XerC
MRRSELANITFNDVDTFNMNIKVLGKGNKVRMVPILKEWIQLYNYYLKTFSSQLNKEYIFCDKNRKRISIPSIYQVAKKYLSLVTTKQKKSPHVLRHSFATHMLNNGADLNSIKELLGHSNLAATQVYTHNTIEKLKKSFQQSHPRSGK